MEIERRAVDPAELGRRVLELFELQLDRKGLTAGFEADDLPPFVLADDTRVRQILLNLVGNAVKFTAGSVQLLARYDHARQRLRYEVHDTGPGIPAEHISRLFLRFAQVDASTTRTYGGTGLGLSICRGLAEAMGGEIGVDSALGDGSRFWVELPCPVTHQSAERRSALGGAEAVSALTGARVLVVDDNAANRELARVICQSFGMTVIDAASGAEAAALAAREPLDAILLDVRMPGLGGPVSVRMIRSQPGPNRSTPIIAFTAEVEGDHDGAWGELFQGVLAKPMSAAEVLAALAKVCRSPGLRPHWNTAGAAGRQPARP